MRGAIARSRAVAVEEAMNRCWVWVWLVLWIPGSVSAAIFDHADSWLTVKIAEQPRVDVQGVFDGMVGCIIDPKFEV